MLAGAACENCAVESGKDKVANEIKRRHGCGQVGWGMGDGTRKPNLIPGIRNVEITKGGGKRGRRGERKNANVWTGKETWTVQRQRRLGSKESNGGGMQKKKIDWWRKRSREGTLGTKERN